MSASKDILLFGATGLIGTYILQSLVDSKSSFGRLGIFTSQGTVESKAAEIQSLKDKGVEIFVGDLDSETDVLKAYNGFDTVVSALGRNALAKQIELIRLAEQTPAIKRFFPSEYGTDIEYWPRSANEKPHQQKLKVRAYFKTTATRLEHTYVVTGPYADGYMGPFKVDPRAGSFDVPAKKAVLLGTGDEKVSLTTMRDVGKLVVAALKHYEYSKNRALKVNSFTTTPREILAEFERQTDSKWESSCTSLEELGKLEQEAWDTGKSHATAITLRRIWTEGGTLYEKRDNEAIGASDMDTLADAVQIVIKGN